MAGVVLGGGSPFPVNNNKGDDSGGAADDDAYHDYSNMKESEAWEVELGCAPSDKDLDSARKNNELRFPVKLHCLLSDMMRRGREDIASWNHHGRAFTIHKPAEFVREMLPLWFGQTKFSSFQRQLNLYSFKRLLAGNEKGSFYHEKFLRGKRFLTLQIRRNRGPARKSTVTPDNEPKFYLMRPVQTDMGTCGSSAVDVVSSTSVAAVKAQPRRKEQTVPLSTRNRREPITAPTSSRVEGFAAHRNVDDRSRLDERSRLESLLDSLGPRRRRVVDSDDALVRQLLEAVEAAPPPPTPKGTSAISDLDIIGGLSRLLPSLDPLGALRSSFDVEELIRGRELLAVARLLEPTSSSISAVAAPPEPSIESSLSSSQLRPLLTGRDDKGDTAADLTRVLALQQLLRRGL